MLLKTVPLSEVPVSCSSGKIYEVEFTERSPASAPEGMVLFLRRLSKFAFQYLSSRSIRRIPASLKAELPAIEEDWFVRRYKMNSSAPETFVNGRLEFQKACIQANRSRDNFKTICELYKSFLDGNFTGRFCLDGHCSKIFMVEISFGGFEWGATPKTFHSKKEAEIEAAALKHKYPFISEYRVISRNIEEEEKK